MPAWLLASKWNSWGRKYIADPFPLHETFPRFGFCGITRPNSPVSLPFPSQSSLLVPPPLSSVCTSGRPKDQFFHFSSHSLDDLILLTLSTVYTLTTPKFSPSSRLQRIISNTLLNISTWLWHRHFRFKMSQQISQFPVLTFHLPVPLNGVSLSLLHFPKSEVRTPS